MKRLPALLAGVIFVSVAAAQRPIETDATRTPSFQTGGNVLIRNGRVLTVTQGFLDGADVLVRGGKIVALGKGLSAPAGVRVIDAAGRFVSPGLVDAHSHAASDDTNEWSDAVVSETRIADILNPDQLGVWQALASGITSGLILHGSANPVGGQSLVIKYKWRSPYEEVVFPGAPRMIKFALGENPKRPGQDGSQNNPFRFPGTRMGVEAVIRRAFADAREYARNWDAYRKSPAGKSAPRRDLRLEALAQVLSGEIVVQCHSYRQDEILMMAKLSRELGFKLVMQHALEAYKVAPELAKLGVPVSIFGDAFAYKLEVIDSIPMATAILDRAGVLVSVNTDTWSGHLPLHLDAAKAMRYGVSEERALRMITINPARQLGIDRRVGSIEVGKDADLAIWQGHPLSTFSKCAMTLVDGEVRFERRDAFKVDPKSAAASATRPLPFKAAPELVVRPGTTGFLLRGATVHPVSGPEMTRADVLTDGVKILAVGRDLKPRPGTMTIDAKGLQVWPGFIDAGSQLGLAQIGQVPSATDLDERGEINPDLRALTAVNPEAFQFGTARFNGVTNALVVPQAGLLPGQAAFIHTQGFTNDELDGGSPGGLVVNVPEGLSAAQREVMEADDRAKQTKEVGDRRRRVREWFVASRRYLDGQATGGAASRDAKQDAMRPYLQGERPVLFVARGTDAIRWAVRFAKEMRVRPVILGGGEAWRIPDVLKSDDVPVVLDAPTVACPSAVESPDPLDPYDTVYTAAEVLRAAAIRIAFRTNTWDGVQNLPFMAGRYCAFGLPKAAAMRGLTLDAARILGVADRLGSLEPGKIANFVVTDGDPLELTTQTRFVFVNGRPTSLRNHFTDLWEKYNGRLSR
ncbi:MAG: amidohydrolase family protein [Fimbriimonas sp.]